MKQLLLAALAVSFLIGCNMEDRKAQQDGTEKTDQDTEKNMKSSKGEE